MKKVLRKSLITILVLATIMSTLAMFGFASSAAVEDEAAVMSTNDIENRGILTTYNECYVEDVLLNIDASTIYEYDLIPVYPGTYIIQTFGASNFGTSVDLTLTGNDVSLSTISMPSLRSKGYGYNQMLCFTVSADNTSTNYELTVTPRSQTTEARISVTYADGFFTQGTPSQYEHIVAFGDDESVSHNFYNITDPAKVCLYDCEDDGTLTIGVEGYAKVFVIDPTLISQSEIMYVAESEIEFDVTEGVQYYIVFYPNYGDGIDDIPLITLTFSQTS